jgi:lysyl-tRNA synthetase class 2
MTTWQKLKNNPALWFKYFLRERAIKQIRLFFDTQGFHEVETPILIGRPPAESYLDVFQTALLDRKRNSTPMYLSTSPELSLKKLMVAGIGNCYALTKSFRNTEVGDTLHIPEFTILEWYRVGVTYTDIMKDCEKLMLSLCPIGQKSPICPTLSYQGKEINIKPPWQRISVKDAFEKWAHVDLEEFFDIPNARSIIKSKGYTVSDKNTWEELYNQIFLNEIEPHLGIDQPTIIYDFPGTIAALAKKKDDDKRYAERFEFYIGGLELGDCYTELTDWKEQEARFDNELKKVKRLGKTSYDYDHDFICALKSGLPACTGVAIGVDRLLMLLLDTTNIKDTLLFPIEDLL